MGLKTDNMIFVFGSNLAGRHGAGAALYARNYRGAIYGQGVGRAGQSYAIPTKDYNVQTMRYQDIRPFVAEFLEYARVHPELHFQVTQLGCGLAGLDSQIMAEMFLTANRMNYPNVHFDKAWAHNFGASGKASLAGYSYWGTFN